MSSRGLLSPREAFWLLTIMMMPTITLMLPGDLLRSGGGFAWWTPLVTAVPAAALCALAGWAAAARGPLDAVWRAALGPRAGRLPLLPVLACIGALLVFITGEVTDVSLLTYIYEDVPPWLIAALLLAAAGLAAYFGLTVIGRGAAVVAPLTIIITYGLVAAGLPMAHLIWGLPLLPRNAAFLHPQPVLRTLVWLSEPMLIVVLVGRFDGRARAAAAGLACGAMVLAAGLLCVLVWALVAIFGPPRAAGLLLPLFSLSKEITLGIFVNQSDVLLIPIAVLGGVGKLAVFLWLWTEVGSAASGGGRTAWLVAGALGSGAGSLLAFRSALVLDRTLYPVLGLLATPVLAASLLLPYALTRPRGARSG